MSARPAITGRREIGMHPFSLSSTESGFADSRLVSSGLAHSIPLYGYCGICFRDILGPILRLFGACHVGRLRGVTGLSNVEVRTQVDELAAQLAAAHDKMPLSDLLTLRGVANTAVRILDEAKEFRRVSEIANRRAATIEAELAQITSDEPFMREIQDAIASVKLEQAGSNLRSLQNALGHLNKSYDSHSKQLEQRKFDVH
jgi:hypothetical protein